MVFRSLLAALTAVLLSVSSCRTAQPTADAVPSGRNLIIFYDSTIGNKPLLKAVKKYGSKLIYQYRNFHGVAVTIPPRFTTPQAIEYYKKVKGVLNVEEDRKMQLNNMQIESQR